MRWSGSHFSGQFCTIRCGQITGISGAFVVAGKCHVVEIGSKRKVAAQLSCRSKPAGDLLPGTWTWHQRTDSCDRNQVGIGIVRLNRVKARCMGRFCVSPELGKCTP